MMEDYQKSNPAGLRIDLIDPVNISKDNVRQGLTEAAVLVPLLQNGRGWEILFTRRSNTVMHHKGQVSFPGGMAEPHDTGPVATALREANEEINIELDSVKIIGCLPDVISISNYWITPVVGVLESASKLFIRTDEVDKIFTVPVAFLSDSRNSFTEIRQLPSGDLAEVVFYKEYQGEQVWGITAAITRELINRIK
jgi:8-oxo-dGTP pyrophosphatase MutT (NUDIX family)